MAAWTCQHPSHLLLHTVPYANSCLYAISDTAFNQPAEMHVHLYCLVLRSPLERWTISALTKQIAERSFIVKYHQESITGTRNPYR